MGVKHDGLTQGHWDRLEAFWARVQDHGWGGLHFQHAALCRRRAWLHASGVRAVNERMRRASVAHDQAFSRDRSLVGLMGIAPDRVLWEERVVVEHKAGSAAHDCARAQGLFYAAGFSASTGQGWRCRLMSLKTRRREDLVVDLAAMDWLEDLAGFLESTERIPVPAPARIPACAACSFLDWCFPTPPPDFEV